MRSFRKIIINMRSESLDRLIRAYLSDNAPSRTSVCENTGVCKITASKVANALIESGFMCEKLFSLDGKERPRLHLFLRESVRILLIDFSSPRFKMSIISNDASILFESSYNYDSSVTFDDNINIFLSRCGLTLKHSGHGFSAISVLYADQEHKSFIESSTYQAHLPSIRQRDIISRAIYEILRKTPETHLTVSDAICEAMRFRARGNDTLNGCSYIFVGSRLFAFHSYANGSRTVCSPEKLLSDTEKQLFHQPHLTAKENTDDIFVKLCGFMDAAFSPSVVILESDIHTPDDTTARKIIRAFALSGRNTPLINARTSDSNDPLHMHGILRCTVLSLIKRYISGI